MVNKNKDWLKISEKSKNGKKFNNLIVFVCVQCSLNIDCNFFPFFHLSFCKYSHKI